MSALSAAGVLLTPNVYDDNTVSPGWLGLVVFLALAAATAFLLRSMFRHLRKVPRTFDQPGSEAEDSPRPPTGSGGAAGSPGPSGA